MKKGKAARKIVSLILTLTMVFGMLPEGLSLRAQAADAVSQDTGSGDSISADGTDLSGGSVSSDDADEPAGGVSDNDADEPAGSVSADDAEEPVASDSADEADGSEDVYSDQEQADGDGEPAVVNLSGSGTAEDPYVIGNAEDWSVFAEIISNGTAADEYYKLADDFDNEAEPVSVAVGEQGKAFCGTFDGNGKTLHVGLNDAERQGLAPFAEIEGATIINLIVEGNVSGDAYSAGLVGFSRSGENRIENCALKATVTYAGTNGDGCIGGVVGHACASTLSFDNVACISEMSTNGAYAGGLVGIISKNADVTIHYCFFGGSCSGAADFHPLVYSQTGYAEFHVSDAYYSVVPVSSEDCLLGTEASTSVPDGKVWRSLEFAHGIKAYFPAEITSVMKTYLYTGKPINVNYELIDACVSCWKERETYEVTFSPAEVKDVGTYTLTVSGIGEGCGGSQSLDFSVISEMTEVSSGEQLQAVFNTGGIIRLTEDIGTGEELTVPAGKQITVDVDGHTISRGIFIKEGAVLQLRDSGENGGILDGYVYLEPRAGFVMESGKISGFTGSRKAVVYVDGGTFQMNGGEISNNDNKSDSGSIVIIKENGFFIMNDGEVCRNTAVNVSAFQVYEGGTFCMKGGKICKNSSQRGGAAIHCGGKLEISGGEISENISEGKYGAVTLFNYCSNHAFRLSGAPVIKNNKSNKKGENKDSDVALVISSSGDGVLPYIRVSESLSVAAQIGLDIETSGIFAKGLSGEEQLHCFFSNDPTQELSYQDGNGIMGPKKYEIHVQSCENGHVEVPERAEKNAVITPSCIPDNGQALLSIKIIGKNGKEIGINENGSFVMPDSNVTIEAVFGPGITIMTSAGEKGACYVLSDTTEWIAPWYVVTEDVTIESRVTVKGAVSLYLCEGATLNCKAGIEVSRGNGLTIEGEGKLIASGNDYDAGLGGSYAIACGSVTIKSGTVEASSNKGPGIGSGIASWGDTAKITIEGGTVFAYGGRGAGIGGGEGVDSGTIYIKGGYVCAYGCGGAGIGGGEALYDMWNHENRYGAANLICITGGRVYAYAYSTFGAAIGSGGRQTNDNAIADDISEIRILGGQVTAECRRAGIGCGPNADVSPHIARIELGWTEPDDFIEISNGCFSGNGGSLSFQKGLRLMDSGSVATASDIAYDPSVVDPSVVKTVRLVPDIASTKCVRVLPGKGVVRDVPVSSDTSVSGISGLSELGAEAAMIQSGISGEMEPMHFFAAEGYYFPEDYGMEAVNGITLTRDSYKQVTVCGMPTENTDITLPAATEVAGADVSDIVIEAAGTDSVLLRGLADGEEYILEKAYPSSFTAEGSTQLICDIPVIPGGSACSVCLYRKGNGTTTKDSSKRYFSVSIPAAPEAVAYNCTSGANDDGRIANVSTAVEYRRSDSAVWTQSTAEEITGLAPGTYYVRFAAVNKSGYEVELPSEVQTLVIKAYSAEGQVKAPLFTPAAGEYREAQSVTISCETDGAGIFYTTNGDVPTAESNEYTGPITVNSTMTIRALAVKEGMTDSAVSEAAITILSLPAPVYTAPAAVSGLVYDGKEHELVTAGSVSGGRIYYAVTESGAEAPEDELYQLTVPKKSLPGSYDVWYKVSGDDAHSDVAAQKVSAVLAKVDISQGTVTLGAKLSYNGTEQTETVECLMLGARKIPSSEYTVSGNTGTDAGSYSLTVTAKEDGYCTGSLTKTFVIDRQMITPTISISGSYSYTGSPVIPAVTLKNGETEMPESDYIVSFSDNVNVGRATVLVTAADGGNYGFEKRTLISGSRKRKRPYFVR